METFTRTLLFSAIFLFLLPLPRACQAGHSDHDEPLDCFDLLTLLDLFRGEFDNFRQSEMDRQTGATDFHFYIHRFHVPVRVSALRRIGSYCSFTQQMYLEQYLGNSTAPFQRIFNFVLKDGHIFMETRKHRNASATKVWTNWRQDTKQFENLKAEDLLFDSKCNVEWMKLAVGIYEAVNMTGDCTFNFNNRKDLLSTPKLPGMSKERNLRLEAIQIFKSMRFKHPSCFRHKLRVKELRASYKSPKCPSSPGK